MEEGQRDFAGIVMREDAMRNIAASGRRWLVLVYRYFQRDDCAFRRVNDAGAVAPVDHAMRRQKQKLADFRLRARYVGAEQFAKQGGDLRANA